MGSPSSGVQPSKFAPADWLRGIFAFDRELTDQARGQASAEECTASPGNPPWTGSSPSLRSPMTFLMCAERIAN